MNALERIKELRARAPKAFDLGCAVLVGLLLAWMWSR